MKQLHNFNFSVQEAIWGTDPAQVGRLRLGLIQSVRAVIIALRGFTTHHCYLQASALTFYTLLSIVPVIAMLFGIAKGFGFEKRLEAEFKSDLSYNQEVIDYVFDLATSMLENTQGGLVAGLGVAILFWSVMKVLGNIEEAFNEIWEVREARTWARKFSDYLSIMLLAPVLIIISSSISLVISTRVESATRSIEILGYFGPAIYFGLRFLRVFSTVALFALTYMILPNTRVNVSAALFGALFGTLIFMAVEWAYLTFQVGVSNYNAIYGGFAALPLFLVWVQSNWLVVLFGAELCVAFQSHSLFAFGRNASELSLSSRFMLALAVIRALIERFREGETGPTASEISEKIRIPEKLVQAVLNDLVQCHVVSKVVDAELDEAGYLPAIDIAKLDFTFVLERLTEFGSNDIPGDESFKGIEEAMKKIREEFSKSKHNLLIKDL
ncbi:MAG: YihY/virulence factor BrkB family protein [Gammaproteobacteria bacterium]